MAIFSTLRKTLSQVFHVKQEEIDEDFDVEPTQATVEDPPEANNVANSITFVEGPDGAHRIEGDSDIVEQGIFSGPKGDIARGTSVVQGASQASNPGSLTFSQKIDDEEWANALCAEDIEA
ncbi:hypothetical protein FRC01_009037, partial [Tulasnella sp. 417]